MTTTTSPAIVQVVDQVITDQYSLYHGDCIETIRGIPSNSLDGSIFSPPFESLYTYSNSERDMGNSRGSEQFREHYRFLATELTRVLKPGRLLMIHCQDITSMKAMHGYIGLRDFPGDLIRIHQEYGMIYHSRVTIWKDPVVEMQRTKALGLLWKQLKKDAAMSRQGLPDYLVVFRKPGTNPDPVTHDANDFPLERWQRYASPCWFDINQTRVLSREGAREEQDERHICPLQLDTIDRCIDLWTNPGDTILDPFAGIGSTGYEAIQRGRKFVGIELKGSYFTQMVGNLRAAAEMAHTPTLFDLAAIDAQTGAAAPTEQDDSQTETMEAVS